MILSDLSNVHKWEFMYQKQTKALEEKNEVGRQRLEVLTDECLTGPSVSVLQNRGPVAKRLQRGWFAGKGPCQTRLGTKGGC